ncbi:MAG: hypothetical protein ACXACI_13310 [Candidatus Hodarchaeales archaeon]
MEETVITSFMPHGGSVVAELKEVLKRRGRKLEQFEYYKNIFGGLIKELMANFEAEEETVLHAIFVSKFALSELRKTELDAQTRVTEVTHIRMVLEALIESRKHLTISLDDLVALLQITVEVANRIERHFVENWRLHVPEDVIAVNISDLLVKPLFEFYREYCGKDADFHWIMAEVEGALRNSFAKTQYEELVQIFPTLPLEPQNYLIAGYFVIVRYFRWYHLDDVKQTFVSQTRSIEEPEHMFGTTIFFDENRELIDTPHFTREIDPDELATARSAIHSLSQIGDAFSRKFDFKLRFAKFRLRMRSQNQMLSERAMFATFAESSEQSRGAISAMVLPAEDINVQYVSNMLLMRCFDLEGFFSTAKTLKDSTFISSIQPNWSKALQYNTQNLSDTLETVDTFRDAAGLPVAAIAQEMSQSDTEYVLGKFDSENWERLSDFLSHITQACNDFVMAALRGIESATSDLELIPWEFVLEHRENSGEMLLFQFANDDARITGIMTHVEPEKFQVDPGRLMKRRVVQSKAGQLLSQKRIDTLQDAINKKMQDAFRIFHAEQMLLSFYCRSEISSEIESETVAEVAVEELMKKQAARQELFEEFLAPFVHDEIVVRIGEMFLQLARHKGGVREEGLLELEQHVKEERARLGSLRILETLPEEISRGVRIIIDSTIEDVRKNLFDNIEVLKALSDRCQKLEEADFQRIIDALGNSTLQHK